MHFSWRNKLPLAGLISYQRFYNQRGMICSGPTWGRNFLRRGSWSVQSQSRFSYLQSGPFPLASVFEPSDTAYMRLQGSIEFYGVRAFAAHAKNRVQRVSSIVLRGRVCRSETRIESGTRTGPAGVFRIKADRRRRAVIGTWEKNQKSENDGMGTKQTAEGPSEMQMQMQLREIDQVQSSNALTHHDDDDDDAAQAEVRQ